MRRLLTLVLLLAAPVAAHAAPNVVKSARSGSWSESTTWVDGKVPAAGDKVLVRVGHTVTYDVKSVAVIRSLFIVGTLTFTPDKDTELNVGLIKIQHGEELDENGFDCSTHPKDEKPLPKFDTARPGFTTACLCCDGKPTLLVGTPETPIAAGRSAKIRLHYIDGMDKESCPAIVCCGGRMDFHGQPMSRTWVKLGKDATGTELTLSEAVRGWRVGDRVIVTTSAGSHNTKGTEVRTIRAIADATVSLDRALESHHAGEGEFRTEVANLTRNVVIESASPEGVRGHTMYHKGSAGSINFAEFRHLGKKGLLGRYPIHFHLCRDTMRGSSVVGASVWDSHNRWVTIHGTEYLVVRDCVGYQSTGHGYFLEDGTEVYNVLDRNLAVQALEGVAPPKQPLPFDKNEGAGFWWANSHNTFTRNVAAECDGYGFRFEATPQAGPFVKPKKGEPRPEPFDLRLSVRQPNGQREAMDIRTMPFVRFDGNEAHHIGTYGLNLGQDSGGVGPERDRPFVVRDMKIWFCGRGYTVDVPHVRIDGLRIHRCGYEVYRSRFVGQDYRDVRFTGISGKYTMASLEDYRAIGQLNRSRLPGFPQGTGAGGTAFAGAEIEVAKLEPIDKLTPITVITHVRKDGDNLVVRGTTSDNGVLKRVTVNGLTAKVAANGEWEVTLATKAGAVKLTAQAEDAVGNAEKTPHELTVVVR